MIQFQYRALIYVVLAILNIYPILIITKVMHDRGWNWLHFWVVMSNVACILVCVIGARTMYKRNGKWW